ncbi:Tfp pilus assembly protein PilF [Sphingomonas kaistensis]|uniref:Tfp pilus assembly protein PilF n=1 Tax=Sphingomonas kaistensis TaxID=298708 RepID=A0A7X6BGU9_9SPHN|nr:hypothetical protein [Sphingomonas kaistensis]NJC05825.1 Tfp pilus assembly protein PilF [Sphingomonas kaistensis]
MNALLFAAFLATGAAQPAELDYSTGALAYQALVTGDLSLAERQLVGSQAANRNDGAWLLNYGQLLARQGRVNEAREVFRQVDRAPDSEIVLASGEVMGTREVSRIAARRLTQQSLSAR